MALLKDFAAMLLLRLAVLLLSPGLLVAGRSLRAKAIGLRALLAVGVVALTLASVAALRFGWLPRRAGAVSTLSAAALGLFAFLPLDAALHFTRPRRAAEIADAAEGAGHWASIDTVDWSAGHAEATVAVENDFIGLAVQVLTRLDPRLWFGRGGAVREAVADDLEALAERPALERLPSALSWDAGLHSPDLFGTAPDREHAFVYVPPHPPDESLPVVVVCHGHGGNPLLGCAVWETLADDLGFVAAFPTFGYGNWEHDSAATAVLKCRQAVARQFGADAGRAVLAGLSQGGCGVTRGAVAARWAGLVYVSATMERRLLEPDTPFAEVWRGKPVLVAHGLKDVNVRPATVTAAVEAMRAAGVSVTYVADPEADHFYLFEQGDDFGAAFRAWWATLPGLGRDHADVVAEQPAAEQPE